MEKGLLEKTGKSLDKWIQIVKKAKIEKHNEIIKFLKSEHGFTHGFANFVALKTRASDAGSFDADDLVSTQYSKGKEGLKSIYDKLVKEITKLGKDVEIAPKKANVSFRRKKQFALVQPSTKTRVDIGLKITEKKTTERLEDSGIFGAMCTHRIRITDIKEIDKELISWIKEAYEAAG